MKPILTARFAVALCGFVVMLGLGVAALIGSARADGDGDHIFQTPGGAIITPGLGMCLNSAGQAVPTTSTCAGAQNVVSTSDYPLGATPYTASATGTTAATTATLAGASSVTTYLCGFSIRANATSAATGNATVTGTISGTLNFTQWTAPLASGIGLVEENFKPCVPASAANTSIAVVSAAPGTGGIVSVSAWGYKK